MDDLISKHIEDITEIKVVYSGGAKGADTLANMWASSYGINIIEILPDWNLYGKRAGMIRNNKIIMNADVVFAFWNGESSGTASSIKIAKSMYKTVHIYTFKSKDN